MCAYLIFFVFFFIYLFSIGHIENEQNMAIEAGEKETHWGLGRSVWLITSHIVGSRSEALAKTFRFQHWKTSQVDGPLSCYWAGSWHWWLPRSDVVSAKDDQGGGRPSRPKPTGSRSACVARQSNPEPIQSERSKTGSIDIQQLRLSLFLSFSIRAVPWLTSQPNNYNKKKSGGNSYTSAWLPVETLTWLW